MGTWARIDTFLGFCNQKSILCIHKLDPFESMLPHLLYVWAYDHSGRLKAVEMELCKSHDQLMFPNLVIIF